MNRVFAPAVRAWWPALCVAVLAACSSPMPPPAGPRLPDPATKPAPALPPASAQPAAPAPGAAVAARFPDPAIGYRTPGLQRRSGFTTQAELEAGLRALTGPQVHLVAAGRSQNGVPIEALLFGSSAPSAEAVRANGRPTVLLLAQQHGDEPAGAEAALAVAQALARGNLRSLTERVNVLLLPRANPDGALAGQRATAQGIDLDTDHLLLRTPEAQAVARLLREYPPAVVLDVQEYGVPPVFAERFGAVPGDDAMLQYAMVGNLPEFVTKASEEWFRVPLLAALGQQGLRAQWYYTPVVASDRDPAERRLAMGEPRTGSVRNASGLRNGIGLLVASRGAGAGREHLPRRVHTLVTAMGSVLQQAADRAGDLVKLRQYVDAEVSAKVCQGTVAVAAASTPSEFTLAMLDPATGADKLVTVNWDSALVLRETVVRTRPCGYWLAADQAEAVARLRQLGVRVAQVAAVGVMQGETYARKPGAAGGEVATQPALLDVSPGSFYVPLGQPAAHLAVAALEPDAPGSWAGAGLVARTDRIARVTALPGMKMMVLP
jgi:hypothetical protein